MKMSSCPERIRALQHQLSAETAVLISNPSDISYFTGLPVAVESSGREAVLVVLHTAARLFHSPLLQAPAGSAALSISAELSFAAVAEYLKEFAACTTLMIDESDLRVAEMNRLTQATSLHLLAPFNREQIWKLRQIKSSTEAATMLAAAQLSQQVLKYARSVLQVGITEQALATKIEFWLKKRGAELAFPTIVAFGANTAVPHHQPGAAQLQSEDAVLFDLGARVDGYCADMTRSFWFGKQPPELYQQIHSAVLAAYQAAVAVLSEPGVTAAEVDAATRTIIAEAGLGEHFIHTTGHGLGLDIHEPPHLYAKDTTPLVPGMLITIEPGIYLPKKFGVRYENTLEISTAGARSITGR